MVTDYSHQMKIRSEALRSRSTAEDGYVLVAVMFLLAILMLSLTVAAPRIKEALERDREVEATHRGKQYIRAIQLYYRKFHNYPSSMDALMMTDNVRFLRKKYVDPITGKDDWTPIHVGQNKVATSFGFFGAEIGGTPISRTGPDGNGTGTSLTSSSGVSNQNPDPGGASTNSTGSPTVGSTSSGSTNGDTFGGAGIMGFSIPSDKRSIMVYKKQAHFNRWEFVYDPMQEAVLNLGGGGGTTTGLNSGLPGSTTGNPLAPGSPGSGTPGSPTGNSPDQGGPPPPPAPVQPPCGGTWSPNGNLPTPCPK